MIRKSFYGKRNKMIYIWSDLHLGHANIIEYEQRPFQNITEMNKKLLHNWRTIIKSNDTIINLGDIAFKTNKEYLSKIIKNLPGYKILIMGNHDRSKSTRWWIEIGFDEVYKYPIIYEGKYILSHEPIFTNEYINIHGHIHNKKTENSELKYLPNQINISVEMIDYKPILFEKIIEQKN